MSLLVNPTKNDEPTRSKMATFLPKFWERHSKQCLIVRSLLCLFYGLLNYSKESKVEYDILMFGTSLKIPSELILIPRKITFLFSLIGICFQSEEWVGYFSKGMLEAFL
ncbi:hypothetical protein V8G54_010979 [Vigna mungo]|uniref:Uncharacterized protein n=1 Tax=Vigna mungo TaxID=3915 RepID=A0AAQ3S1V8_VIGMU